MSSVPSLLLNYFVNALWELPLLFFAGSLLARIARHARPSLHFRLWTAVLAMQIVLPAISAGPQDPFAIVRRLELWLSSAAADPGTQVTASFGPVHVPTGFAVPSVIWRPLLLIYALVTLFFTARLLLGLLQIRRLRQTARPVASSPAWDADWRYLQDRFGIRGAVLAETPRAAGILTVGFRRKLLLAQPGALDALSPQDRLAALAHECAHMCRNDFAWNLLLECVSLPIAFHPCARFALARIAESREMVCDDLAASTVAGRHLYAKSLLRLAAALVPATSAPTLHAIGMLDANTLERRLMRLKQNSSTLRKPQILAMAATALVVLAGTWTTASALHVGVGAMGVHSDAQGTAPLHVDGAIIAGHRTNGVNPVYPEAAKKAGLSGTVVLKATIDENGEVQNLSVLSGPEELRASAIEAVRQWTYEPYVLNGAPVAVETTININYQLN